VGDRFQVDIKLEFLAAREDVTLHEEKYGKVDM
jgi:hypothetical protein